MARAPKLDKPMLTKAGMNSYRICNVEEIPVDIRAMLPRPCRKVEAMKGDDKRNAPEPPNESEPVRYMSEMRVCHVKPLLAGGERAEAIDAR